MKNPLRKYSDTDVEVEMTDEVQEDTEMTEKVSFFARHKKGILIGAGAAALAAIGGLIAANRSSDDFDDYDDEDLGVDGTSDEAGSAADEAE